MRPARWAATVSSVLTAAASVAAGAMLVLEATGTVDGAWRSRLGGWIVSTLTPAVDPWVATLVGLAAAVGAATVILGTFLPPPTGATRMFEVHRFADGTTRIAGRAALRAVRGRLEGLEGVRGVDARLKRGRIEITVEVDDDSDLRSREDAVRAALDHGFWIDLGLADMPVDLVLVPVAPGGRVR